MIKDNKTRIACNVGNINYITYTDTGSHKAQRYKDSSWEVITGIETLACKITNHTSFVNNKRHYSGKT